MTRKHLYIGIGIALVLAVGGALVFTNREGVKDVSQEAKELVGLASTDVPASATEPSHDAHLRKTEPAGAEQKMVQLSPEEQRAIDVETEVVTYRPLQKELFTVGRIDVDERKLAFVPARVAGRLDKLFVNFTGVEVKKGEPLALIYSPDLVAAQREYQLALENLERVKRSEIKEVVESARSLVEASETRLRLWGITDEQTAEMKTSSNPRFQMTISSRIGGTVIEKMVLEGKYVTEGENLYKIADLSTVWMLAEVYEYELPWVRLGQRVEITSLSSPGNASHGTISFIDPVVNPNSRTVKIRADIPNPERKLKPQMFVNAKVVVSLGEKVLAVPKSAVLDTGVRQLVYVDKGNGLYEGREVTLGSEAAGYYPVTKGLGAGERIVVAGNFLIDSQRELTGGTVGMGAMAGMEGMAPGKKDEMVAQQADKLKITFSNSPKSPVVGKNTLKVKVTDQAGKPVTDAKVAFVNSMPAMPGMPGGMSLEEEAKHTGNGEYEALVQLVMAGPWKAVVTVSRPGQPPTSATFSLTVR